MAKNINDSKDLTVTGASRSPKKSSLPQSDVPSFPLVESLRVGRAIAEELAKRPSSPLQVAAAMGMKPTTGLFRTLTAASIAYGITDGGAFADKIGLTDVGRRVVAPTSEGDDRAAMREAVFKPRVTSAFLSQYHGSKWPRDDIARNVLEQMGIAQDQTQRALSLIRADAEALAFLTNINGTDFVDIQHEGDIAAPEPEHGVSPRTPFVAPFQSPNVPPVPSGQQEPPIINNDSKRVFITHGSNHKMVEQIKKLLMFGDFEAVVSVDNQTAAKPVPEKVMDDMRSCTAGIVHVGAEKKVVDADGVEHVMLNPNVLIEIGAAMAIYRRRFILLVERGVTLPSNLQGLYQVRYEGDGLDHDSTMRLLEAFGDFKKVAPAVTPA